MLLSVVHVPVAVLDERCRVTTVDAGSRSLVPCGAGACLRPMPAPARSFAAVQRIIIRGMIDPWWLMSV